MQERGLRHLPVESTFSFLCHERRIYEKIVFVCLGNICRSPMAEFVMKDMTSQFHIESRATSNWEHGNPIYPGTQKIFQKHKIPMTR